MTPVALAFAVLDAGGGAGAVGVVLAAETVGMLVCVLLGGALADRLSRVRLVVAAEVVAAVAQLVAAALLLTGSASVPALVALELGVGAAAGVLNPALTALVPVSVGPKALPRANAALGLAERGATFTGPAAAGLLVAGAGSGVALLVDAATFAAGAVLVSRVRAPSPSREGPLRPLRDLAEGWQEFGRRSWLYGLVAWYSTLMLLVQGPLLVLGPIEADRRLGGAAAWGLVLGSLGAGAVLGGVSALRWRGRRPLLEATAAYPLLALLPAALALEAPLAVIAAAAVPGGVAGARFSAAWFTALGQRVPADALARVSAFDWLGSMAGLPAGLALAGPLAALLGAGGTLWLAAATVPLATLAVLWRTDLRRLEREPVAVADGPAGAQRTIGRPG